MDPIEQIFAQIQHSGPASAIAAGNAFTSSFQQARGLQRDDRRLDQQDRQLEQQGDYQRAQLGFSRMREQREAGQETRAAEQYDYNKTLRPMLERSNQLAIDSQWLDYRRKLQQQERDVQIQQAESEAASIAIDAGREGYDSFTIQNRMQNLAVHYPAIYSQDAGKALLAGAKSSLMLTSGLASLWNRAGAGAGTLPPNSLLRMPLTGVPGGPVLTMRGPDPAGERRLVVDEANLKLREQALRQRIKEQDEQLPAHLRPVRAAVLDAVGNNPMLSYQPDELIKAIEAANDAFLRKHGFAPGAPIAAPTGAKPGAPATDPADPLGLFK